MSNIQKDHPSIRLHAPPGGHSNNIFGTSEFEQSAANKKNNMSSDIFGNKKDAHEPAPAAKQSRNAGHNNIFGTEPEETHTRGGTIAGQFKQTQMKSNIFGTDEPAPTRTVSDKNRSNIFGIGDNEQNKTNAGPRHGHRDPNASRMGYNPINGEAYAPKENISANEKQPEPTVQTSENDHQGDTTNKTSATPTNSAPTAPNGNENTQATSVKTNEKEAVQKPVEKPDENNAQKNVHTSVRVVHPPGGRSNGPLW